MNLRHPMAAGMGLLLVILAPRNAGAAVQLASGAQPGVLPVASRGDSFKPVISVDGRYVVFGSVADDLTADLPDGVLDLFRYDRQTGEMVLVSDLDLAPQGRSTEPRSSSTSADGSKLAYVAPTILQFIPSSVTQAAVVRDLTTGSSVVISEPTGSPDFFYPGLIMDLHFNAGGTRVFLAARGGTQPADTNYFSNLRYYDVAAGELHAVIQPVPVLDGVHRPVPVPNDLQLTATPDGRFVAFKSATTALYNPPPAGWPRLREEIWHFDVESQALTLVSVHGAGDEDALGDSSRPSISDDGRLIAYESRSTNLVAQGAHEPGRKVLVYDRLAQVAVLVCTNAAGTLTAGSDATAAALSGDGHWIAFLCDADDLVAGDANNTGDVFLRDMQTGELRRISNHAAWNGVRVRDALKPVISPNGEWVLYQAPGSGVFLYRRSTDTITLITTDCETDAATMTPDGGLVAFTARAKVIDPTSTVPSRNVYVWTRDTGGVELISRRAPDYDRQLPDSGSRLTRDGVSGDGNRFVFRSAARNLSADLPTGAHEGLWVRDLVAKTNILIAAYDAGYRASGPRPFAEAVISRDGRYVAYLSQRTNLPPEGLALDGWDDVFLHDLETGVAQLVTGSRTGEFSGSGNAFGLSVSADGGRVAFVSDATNLTTDPQPPPGVFLWDRATGEIQRVDLANGQTHLNLNPVLAPKVSPDGLRVAFVARAFTSTFHTLMVSAWDGEAAVAVLPTPHRDVLEFTWNPTGEYLAAVVEDGRVYRHQVAGGHNLASPRTSLWPASSPSFDQSGRYLAYFAANGNLPDTYAEVWDTQTGVIDVSPQQLLRADPLWLQGALALSADARFVVYRTKADLAPGTYFSTAQHRRHLRVWDRANGFMGVLDNSLATSEPSEFVPGRFFVTPNGRVVFEAPQPDVVTRDNNLAMDVFVVELVSRDTDSDGMADDWEAAFFDTLDRDGSADADGDTLSDLGEYQAGTIPVHSSSVLSVTTVLAVSADERQVFWRSVPGKRYRVQAKNSLADPAWNNRSEVITATSTSSFFIDGPVFDVPLPDHRYYRVLLEH